MNIAVVDVAAESGGAMSVLLDFLKFMESDVPFCRENQWFLYTSFTPETHHSNIISVVVPEIKKSWFHRLWWENSKAGKSFREQKIDVIISLQNTAFHHVKARQIVYFHNMLLLEPKSRYSLLKKSERKYGIYTRLIAPYTLKSLRSADHIVVQGTSVRDALPEKLRRGSVKVIHPNVEFDSRYRSSATLPVRGLIYPTSPVPFKRVEEIIDCAKVHHDWFAEKNFEVLLTLRGDENEYARGLMDRAAPIRDVVKFIGFRKREEIFELYRTHGLFFSSSLESFSFPFVEAAYVGTPIVGADYPYARERTRGTANSCLYRPGDGEDLFRAIEKVSEMSIRPEEYRIPEGNTWNELIPLIKGEEKYGRG